MSKVFRPNHYFNITASSKEKKKAIPINVVSTNKVWLPLNLLLLLIFLMIPKEVKPWILPTFGTRIRSNSRRLRSVNYYSYHFSFISTSQSNTNLLGIAGRDRIMMSHSTTGATSVEKEEDEDVQHQQTTSSWLTVGNKIQQTAEPCVILMKQIISEYVPLWTDRGGIYSLAQVSKSWS
jgi:hypothetical protein